MARILSMLSVLTVGLLLMAGPASAQLNEGPADWRDRVSPPAAGADGQALDQVYDTIEDFIREKYLSSWFASPRLIRRNFADPLDYYWGKKDVPLKSVIKDKIAYVARWPQRYYRLLGDTLQVSRTEIGDEIYAVRFRYEFETQRPGDQRAGIGETTLLLELVAGRIQIRGEGGKVLERF